MQGALKPAIRGTRLRPLWLVGIVGAGLVLGGVSWFQPGAGESPAAKSGPSPADSGYSIGFSLGREVRTNTADDGVAPDTDAVVRGFTDAIKGVAPGIPEARMNEILADLQKSVDTRRAAERMKTDSVFRAAAEEAASRSATFLTGFAKREGVTVFPSGLEYQVIHAGAGASAEGASTVVVNYEVFLTNGERVAEGQRREAKPEALVAGATEILKHMKQGDRWYVAIPAALAFGAAGHEPGVGPNEALVVDVELVEVKK